MSKLVAKLLQVPYVRNAMDHPADLSSLKQRLTVREALGIGAIGFSYLIGWPLIGLLGILSIYYEQPSLVVVGGTVTYGLSHLVFLLGMYLAGSRYFVVLMRWLTRVGMLKLMRLTNTPCPPCQQDP